MERVTFSVYEDSFPNGTSREVASGFETREGAWAWVKTFSPAPHGAQEPKSRF